MGLVIFAVLGLYLLISIGVVIWAISHAKKHNKSKKHWGTGAALVMYLLVFWDHIPTMVVHKYYCDTEAGFWMYKTVDQWKAENPGVMETLVKNTGKRIVSIGDNRNRTMVFTLNQRFKYVSQFNGKLFLNRWRHSQEITDIKTGEVIAKDLNFSTSQVRSRAGWAGWKFWLHSIQCDSYSNLDTGSISKILNIVEGKYK